MHFTTISFISNLQNFLVEHESNVNRIGALKKTCACVARDIATPFSTPFATPFSTPTPTPTASKSYSLGRSLIDKYCNKSFHTLTFSNFYKCDLDPSFFVYSADIRTMLWLNFHFICTLFSTRTSLSQPRVNITADTFFLLFCHTYFKVAR